MMALEVTDEELALLRTAVLNIMPWSAGSHGLVDGLLAKLDQALRPPITPAPRKDLRDPEVTEVITYFEELLGITLPRGQFQRRAAKTLIQRHGFDKTMKAIAAVSACRGKAYAPQILSIEDLRDKWNKLVEYYRRQAGALKDMDAIRSMTRGE